MHNHEERLDTSRITERTLLGFAVLFGVYVATAAIAGIHGAKLVGIGPFVFDAGLITISFTFLCTDIVSEVYGKAYSKKIVLGGAVGIVTAIIFTRIALLVPGAAEWELAHEYDTILGAGSRVLLAALAAYVGGQFLDITIFSWVRQVTHGKYLWLRNNISTLAGGLADAVFFDHCVLRHIRSCADNYIGLRHSYFHLICRYAFCLCWCASFVSLVSRIETLVHSFLYAMLL